MGGLSSCCAVEDATDKQLIKGDEHAPLDSATMDAFRQRLENSLQVLVLLQDGTKLACDLKFLAADNSLTICCADKVRTIPLSDIRDVLSTEEQLRRVETRANLVDDLNCVGLHLNESGNCIPIRFDAHQDKLAFVQMLLKMSTEPATTET
eukprot:GHVT01029552.1.p1 GENE.GHVT01029552.1~~GHVT01029552.1.p1  ORF type:complete len:151 (+),score=25.27 GHVT01029552.1:469-921(+)